MTLYGLIFYLLAGVILTATLLAVTSRNVMHAIVYLIVSFFGMAPVFYLLGAPLLALLEIIIYAGAIMVLFIFIVMMLRVEAAPSQRARDRFRQWVPAAGLSAVCAVIMVFLLWQEPAYRAALPLALATPREFGRYVFRHYWLAVEIASFLLFVALVGAYYLGRRESGPGQKS